MKISKELLYEIFHPKDIKYYEYLFYIRKKNINIYVFDGSYYLGTRKDIIYRKNNIGITIHIKESYLMRIIRVRKIKMIK